MNSFRLYSLDTKIYNALDKLNYKNPTNVQNLVIPKLIENKNIIVKSKTGSGKTASFAIPICQNIELKNEVQALVIVPTRELCMQVDKEISNIGRNKSIRSVAIFGKQSIKEQVLSLKQRVQVVVATPGRAIDLIERENLNLKNLKYLIIDEADKMFNKGFKEDMKFIFDKSPKDVVVGLFSATIDENINYINKEYNLNADYIEIEEKLTKSQIKENKIFTKEHEKYETLKNIIYSQNPNTTIIFCNTKEKVSSIYRKLNNEKFYVRELSGDMSQERRIFTIKDFKENKFNVLVSTDVASRGIHIDDISLVINYDVVRDVENYVHRIGRTGRQDKFGHAITIYTDKDQKYLQEIEQYLGYEIEKLDELKDVDKGAYIQKTKKIISENRKKPKYQKPKNEEITRLYINAGKKKKIRTIDIVGTLNNIKGINNEDIGVIEIQELCSYVDILNFKGKLIIDKYKELNIKKKLVKVKRDNQGE